jgi:membrane-bound lytic murein transglycosylase A
LAVIETEIPQGNLNKKLVSRYVLDSRYWHAIKGAGRVDIFMGTGKNAGERAGLVNTPGQLYYLLLRE